MGSCGSEVSCCAMSDEKLRELERRYRETGSVDDELAWLRERARAGERLDWLCFSRLHGLDQNEAKLYLLGMGVSMPLANLACSVDPPTPVRLDNSTRLFVARSAILGMLVSPIPEALALESPLTGFVGSCDLFLLLVKAEEFMSCELPAETAAMLATVGDLLQLGAYAQHEGFTAPGVTAAMQEAARWLLCTTWR